MNARQLCMKILEKKAKNHRAFHNLQLNPTILTYRDIEMCLLIRHIFCESLLKLCVVKHKCRSLFSDIWQCCQPARTQILENQKFSYVGII